MSIINCGGASQHETYSISGEWLRIKKHYRGEMKGERRGRISETTTVPRPVMLVRFRRFRGRLRLLRHFRVADFTHQNLLFIDFPFVHDLDARPLALRAGAPALIRLGAYPFSPVGL